MTFESVHGWRALAAAATITCTVGLGLATPAFAAGESTAASTAAPTSTAGSSSAAPVSGSPAVSSPAGPAGSAGSATSAGSAGTATSASTSSAAKPSRAAGSASAALHRTAPLAAGSATAYLVGQLVDGDHLVNTFGADYGLTADLAIALAAGGGQDAALAKVVGYLRAHVGDYADPAGTSSFPGPYSGAVGKLALIAEITGQDPTSFGGFNLIQTLTDHVCMAADSAGSCTAAGDFYQSFSSISQSLAVLALARANVAVPASALARLAQLQCSDGGFSASLLAPGDTCSSDPDATGFAAQALSLLSGAGSQLSQATSYLRTTQQADGGFIGTAGENTNSTGLATQALLAAPGDLANAAAAARAQSFELSLQNADGGFGISSASPASDVRSTTQAVPAVAGQTLASMSDHVTPVTPPVATSSAPASSTAARTSTPASSSPAGSVLPTNTSASSVGAVNAGQTSQLPRTGADPARLLWWAVLLLVAGGLAVGSSYRRPAIATRLANRRGLDRRQH